MTLTANQKHPVFDSIKRSICIESKVEIQISILSKVSQGIYSKAHNYQYSAK